MAPADEEGGFKVTDRRRRSDDDDLEPSARQVAASPRVDAPRSGPAREAERPVPPPQPTGSSGSQPSERNLSGLFVMLASSAAMAMGDAPDPMTGEVHRDLAQAAELVDLLLLLRDKTEGNRTPEETQVLDEVVYDLQLRYVAATKRSAPPRGQARP
jgi:hypothetical protein